LKITAYGVNIKKICFFRKYGMKFNVKKICALILGVVMLFCTTACGETPPGEQSDAIILKNATDVKNVILMIGDGMGPNQIKAGEVFKGDKLTFQEFPYMTTVETRSASDLITDSAAASTAMATGTRTTNGFIGKTPESVELTTIVDIASGLGKRTGVIATEELYGATPMGFSGHANNRSNRDELLQSAASSSNVNLFSSYAVGVNPNPFLDAGYQMVDNVADLSEATVDKVLGLYMVTANNQMIESGNGWVSLGNVVFEALEYLSKDPDGFFLMAEGSHIDHGGHNNDICYMLEELMAFDEAVQVVLEWAKNRDDTVVIVTADHETGGLVFDENTTHEELKRIYKNGGEGDCYQWTTTGHSATDVHLYVNGADINFANYSFGTSNRIKNIDIFQIVNSLMTN